MLTMTIESEDPCGKNLLALEVANMLLGLWLETSIVSWGHMKKEVEGPLMPLLVWSFKLSLIHVIWCIWTQVVCFSHGQRTPLLAWTPGWTGPFVVMIGLIAGTQSTAQPSIGIPQIMPPFCSHLLMMSLVAQSLSDSSLLGPCTQPFRRWWLTPGQKLCQQLAPWLQYSLSWNNSNKT